MPTSLQNHSPSQFTGTKISSHSHTNTPGSAAHTCVWNIKEQFSPNDTYLELKTLQQGPQLIVHQSHTLSKSGRPGEGRQKELTAR